MKKHNLVRVITFISILILFFAQSVYDSSVHARMDKIEDDSLSDIDAAALDIDMFVTVRSVVSGGLNLNDAKAANRDSINISYMEVGDANLTAGSSFQLRTSMAWDIGHNGTQPYILGGNVYLPLINPGMGVNMVGVYLQNDGGGIGGAGGNLPIANASMRGLIFGQNVLTGAPNLDPFVGSSFTTPWIMISDRHQAADFQGIKAFGEMSLYINDIALAWRGDPVPTDTNTRVVAQGLYVYGMMNDYANLATNPASWGTRQRMMKMGGSFPLYNVTTGAATGAATATLYGTLDLGSSATSRTTRVNTNLPMSGSIRIKNVSFGASDWGPFALDDVAFYTNRLILREL